MKSVLRVAAIQVNSSIDKRANLAASEKFLIEAAEGGAELVVLPELFNSLGNLADVIPQAESIPGETSRWLAEQARKLGIVLCAGSICERAEEPGKGYNTSLLFDAQGNQLAAYRKIHLFDAEIPGQVSVCESDWMLPGDQTATSSTSLAILGQATCYDLRFPELFRRLSQEGAEILLVPAAFTLSTGRDHWHTLLRARAIENQAFVIAANQCGAHTRNLVSYGHSMILDPWGVVLAEADETTPQLIFADLNNQRMQEIRQRLPALANRRLV